MQENKFERQVQQKLDELKLDPSDSVWQNIYIKIKKEKRRRQGLIIFPVLFILFLCGGLWLWFPGIHSTKELQQPSKKVIAKKNATEKLNIDLNSTKNKIIVIKENKKTLKSTSATSYRENNNVIIIEPDVKSKKNKVIPANSSGDIVADFTDKINDAYRIKENETFADAKPRNSEGENKINDGNKIIIHHKKNQPDSITNSRDSSISQVILTSKPTDQELKKEMAIGKEKISKIKRNKEKWIWGISFSAGVSDISHSFLGSDFLGSGSAEKSLFADASSYTGSPQPGTDTLSNSSKKPYIIKPSLALNIGFFRAKKISKNLSITLGINYRPFSTTNRVGEKNDSTRNYQYYRTQNPVNSYKNYYHFIAIPVTFSLQLAKPKKIPLVLNAGISISQLIASNALQFNNTSGIYYYDNSLFNKSQIGFSTGIYLSNKKKTILIGPHIYYGTSKIAREGLYKNAHFTYLGLHSNFLFNKK